MELGSPLEMSEREYRYYESAGADRVVVMLPPQRDRLMPLLERYARFIEEVIGGATCREKLKHTTSSSPGPDSRE